MSKINIKNRLIVDTEDVLAAIPLTDNKTGEFNLWVKYKKFDAYISWEEKFARDEALKLLQKTILTERLPDRIILEHRLLLHINLFIAANIEKSRIKIITDLTYPFNRIFVTPSSHETLEKYMKQISNKVGT